MKKRTLLICVLLACAMLLASCQGIADALRPDPKTADELWERIGEAMQGYDAYAMSLEMDMVMVVAGHEMISKATGTMIEDAGEDYYYYSETDVTVSCEELDMEETVKSISAYADGRAFEFRGENGYERKLYSKMTSEEYQAYKASDEQEEEPDFGDCTQESFAQNEDKTWTLTYSGYTKKTINIITNAFSGIADVFGADIEDMQVTFKTNEDFRVTDIGIVFEFAKPEDGAAEPQLDIRLGLDAVGDEVVRVTDTIDPKKYKEVDDLAIRKQIDDMIEQRNQAEQGKFEYKMIQTVKVMGQTETYDETSIVKYGVEDGKYFYEIELSVNGESAGVTYKNGTLTVTYEGESYDEPQTEQEAKELIESMINDPTLGYNSESITNITKKNDGIWEIELAVSDTATFDELYDALGGTYKSATQTVTVTVQDGKLIRIKNVLASRGSIQSGRDTYEVTLTIQMETSFLD